ncbi:glycosyltransferase [Lacibacter luteus]|uniref:Glycosyltransferase n=1 Tax=Lacibacter luteus TaxID=2508719 RepID=A0A4Q1CI33_9BACT|nr:glycosyltransferase [Lacibacter luteus]RXK60016.1 glycosyltransferase [Lacibacter luteus]
MKYWLLTTEYPPFFGGGISTYCYHTAKMLEQHKHSVSVFVHDVAVQSTTIVNDGMIRIIRFNATATKSTAFLGHVTNISYEFANLIKEFIKSEGEPDIIEAQEYLGIAYYLLQFKYLGYKWCKDVPVLVTMHSPSFLYMEYNHVSEYRYPNYWICEMERFCLQAADHIVSPSRFMVDELSKRFTLNHQNISVIPNPYSFRELQSTIDGGNEIIFFGKLTVQKGILQLLNYFKQLWDEGFQRSLTLIGGQDIVYHPEGLSMGAIVRKKYKSYLSAGLLKLEDRIEPSAIEKRLEKAEVIIVPSNNDNLPYVTAEMMSLGKIVLVSEQGGHREVVENEISGFIFDHEKSGSFRQQLITILELDKQKKQEISSRAQKRISEYFGYQKIYESKKQVIDLVVLQKSSKTKFPYIRFNQAVSKNGTSSKGNKNISVVVPYYNMGRYLDQTIRSVKNSSCEVNEIIIVNDGSTEEESIKKLDAYRAVAGIVVIDTVNKGVGAARNTGIKAASGEYVAVLDADDIVEPEYYAIATKVLSTYENVHFVGCWTRYFEGSNKIWPTFSPEPPLILYHNLINSSAIIFKKESIIAAGLYDTKMTFTGLEDYASVISMLAVGYGGIVIPEPLFRYRVRENSMIRDVTKDKKNILVQYISNTFSSLFSSYSHELVNLYNTNGAGIQYDNPTLDYYLSDKIPFLGKHSQKVIKLIKRNRCTKKIAYKLYRFLKK